MPNWREGVRYQHHHYHWRLIPPIWGKVYELTFPLDHILGLFGCGFYYWLWISWAVGSMLYIFHGHLWMQIPHLWNLQFFSGVVKERKECEHIFCGKGHKFDSSPWISKSWKLQFCFKFFSQIIYVPNIGLAHIYEKLWTFCGNVIA